MFYLIVVKLKSISQYVVNVDIIICWINARLKFLDAN